MARPARPWWWEEEQGWYVHCNGKRRFLGKHPSGARPPKKNSKGLWNPPQQILDEFHKLMTTGGVEVSTDSPLLAEILQAFLSWCKENRATRTTERYFEILDLFERRYHGLLALDINAGHVTEWLNEHPTWNSTTKRNAITALMRAFNWGCKNKGLARNPIRGMEKPEAKVRTGMVTPEEFEKLIQNIFLPRRRPKRGQPPKRRKPDQNFRELLIVSFDSGARPVEVKELEARHLQLDKERAVIPKEEAKGRKHPRTIYFPTERCLEIIKRRAAEFPTGPLFRNRIGRKWTGMAVKNRLEDLDHVLGRRIRHYDLRHAWITRKIVAGVDSHVVAKLAGHRDTGMIDRVYGHAAEDYEFMLKNAKKEV